MYAMYPEWGPARHREEEAPMSAQRPSATSAMSASASVQVGLDLRDNGGQRPDDN